MKPGAWSKPKLWRLGSKLGSMAAAVGLLEIVWYEAGEYDPEGGAVPWSKVVERGWLEDGGKRERAALVDGWLDEDEDGTLRVHDWTDHRPYYLEDRARKREERRRRAAERGRAKPSRTVQDGPGQSRTVPDSPTLSGVGVSLPSPSPSPCADRDSPSPSRARPSYPPGFESAWQAYPHHGTRSKKAAAAKVWKRQGLEAQADAVLAWIASARRSDDWRKDGGRYVPGMQTWLRDQDFGEEPPAARPTSARAARSPSDPPLPSGPRWRAMRRALSARIGERSWNDWVGRLGSREDGEAVTLLAPDSLCAEWVGEHFADLIAEVAEEHGIGPPEIETMDREPAMAGKGLET